MDKNDWQQTKKKLKSAFDEGLTYLKEGAREAQFVADKTVHVVKLEVDLLKMKNQLEKAYRKLGRDMAYRVNRAQPLKTDAKIKGDAQAIAKLEKAIAAAERDLNSTTITRKKTAKKKAARPKKISRKK